MNGDNRRELAEKILKVMPLFFDRMIGRRGPRVGPGSIHLLFALRDNPGIIMTALSQQLNIPKPNLTVAVDKLVRDGLVERAFSEHDRRLVSLRLTDKGEEQVEIRKHCMFESTMRGLSRLSDEDAGELSRYIDGITRIVKKYIED